MRMKRTWRVGASIVLVALGGVGRWAPPLGAAVTGISPGLVTIDPGGGANASISIEPGKVSCPTAKPSTTAISASVEPLCSDENNLRLVISTDTDIAPGSYTVQVGDAESSRTLTVRVRDNTPPPTTNPPPPPTATAPPPTTAPTTTVPSTTTTMRSTTSSSTTSSSTTTTAAPTTTTTLPAGVSANADPAGAFASVSSLVAFGIPANGVFVPLTDPGFRNCLPLRAACGDAASGLVIVPARTTSVRWQDPSAAGSTPGLRPLDVAAPASSSRVPAVGDAPAERAGTSTYALPVVSLSPAVGVQAELRTLDASGALAPTTAPPGAAASLLPVAVGPLVPSDSSAPGPTFAGGSPFGRPTTARAALFSEAAPAIVVARGTGGQVLHGIRPDPEWNAGIDLIPLFSEKALAYLVRGVDGPPGLFIARPLDMRVAPADDAAVGTPSPESGRSPVVVLAGTAAVATLLTAAAVANRRRSRNRQ